MGFRDIRRASQLRHQQLQDSHQHTQEIVKGIQRENAQAHTNNKVKGMQQQLTKMQRPQT